MAIWCFTAGLFVFIGCYWLHWMKQAEQQHLQMRNAAHHLNVTNEIIATKRRLQLLEMEREQESQQ